MTTPTCSCGRPLLDQKTSTTCHHHSYAHPQRFTLPDCPKATSTPPPHNLRAPATYASPRRSMDSSSSSSSTHNDISYHRSNSNSTTSSTSSTGSASPLKTIPALSGETRRASSVDLAYSPIAAGFARLSRKERDAADLKARAERAVGLDAGRMFAGAA